MSRTSSFAARVLAYSFERFGQQRVERIADDRGDHALAERLDLDRLASPRRLVAAVDLLDGREAARRLLGGQRDPPPLRSPASRTSTRRVFASMSPPWCRGRRRRGRGARCPRSTGAMFVCRKPPTWPLVAVTGQRYSGASVARRTPPKVRDSQTISGGSCAVPAVDPGVVDRRRRRSRQPCRRTRHSVSERVSSTIQSHGTRPSSRSHFEASERFWSRRAPCRGSWPCRPPRCDQLVEQEAVRGRDLAGARCASRSSWTASRRRAAPVPARP